MMLANSNALYHHHQPQLEEMICSYLFFYCKERLVVNLKHLLANSTLGLKPFSSTQLEEKRKAAESKTCQGKRGLLKVQEVLEQD